MTERCHRCGEYVPEWFLEHVIAAGAFSPPARPAFDDVVGFGWDDSEPGPVCHLEVVPFSQASPRDYPGGNPSLACYHCTNGWPYPNLSEPEDDYVDRLSLWRQGTGAGEEEKE
jgi:hypothetical protein